VSELVRVARDGSAVIAKTDDGSYIRASVDGSGERESADRISVLTAGGGWRRVTSEDLETYKEAAIVAAGRVFVEDSEPKSRIYRVPPTVQKSIREALEAYSPLMADGDREVAARLASQTQVDREDISWMHKFFENIEKALALHGGRRGQNWARKVLSDEVITADGSPVNEVFSEEDVLFIAGTDEESEDLFDTLYMVEPADGSVYVWENGNFSPLDLKDGEIEREFLQEIDPESAQALADRLDSGDSSSLADLFPEERNLFDLAESELDFEYLSLLADATGYSPVERSVNAQRQPRGGGGRFGPGSNPISKSGKTSEAFAKAHLPEGTPLLSNVAARIAEYLGQAAEAVEEPVPVEVPVVSSAVTICVAETDTFKCKRWAPRGQTTCTRHTLSGITAAGTEATPLYLAIVDAVDKTAVLDVVSVIKGADGQATSWRREGSKWVADQNVLADIQGDTPPPLVEMSDEATIKSVLTQVDESDGQAPEPATTEADVMQASAYELSDISAKQRENAAERGYALEDGSFPVRNVADLKNAIQAYGRAKDKTAARKHIRKRARALNRTDLIPDSWAELAAEEPVVAAELFGPYGEVLVASGIPGVADTPEDFRNVARLKRYWAFGPGTAKWLPGTPGDWTRLHRLLRKYVGSHVAPGLTTNIYQMRFGESNASRDKRVGH
jgi:hypothetical protein